MKRQKLSGKFTELTASHHYNLELRIILLLQNPDYLNRFIDSMVRGLTQDAITKLKAIKVDPKKFCATNLLSSIEKEGTKFTQDENGNHPSYTKSRDRHREVVNAIGKIIVQIFGGHYQFYNSHNYRNDICLGKRPSYQPIHDLEQHFNIHNLTEKLEEAYKQVGLDKYTSPDHVLIRWNEVEDIPQLKSDGTLDYYFIDWEKDGAEK